jgi:hypothetical protein
MKREIPLTASRVLDAAIKLARQVEGVIFPPSPVVPAPADMTNRQLFDATYRCSKTASFVTAIT